MKRILILLLCMTLLAGCGSPDQGTESHSSGQRIQLALTPTAEDFENREYTQFSSEELNNHYSGILRYSWKLDNAEILLNSEYTPLHDAIRAGKITGEEFLALAFADAREGYCMQREESKNGLTMFIFSYPDQFDLGVYCDLYETPDGQQHMMNEITVYPYGACEFNHGPFSYINESGELVCLDLEDWGLTFECTQVTSAGMTVRISQSEGQFILGNLRILHCWVYDRDNCMDLTGEDGTLDISIISSAKELTINGSTELTVEWLQNLGSLPSGNYSLILVIEDVYNTDNIEPNQRNYRDIQNYSIDFTVK